MVDLFDFILDESFDDEEDSEKLLTVSELNNEIKDLIERHFLRIWVEGEVTNFHKSDRGHWYFSLKDSYSQIRAVCFSRQNSRLGFSIEDGTHIQVWGKLTIYEQRGEYQIVVESLAPFGKGAIQEAYEQVKEKLEKEGLFDESRKRSLPAFIRRIGIVTSLKGAAIKDMLKMFEEVENLYVTLIPTRVQGEGASLSISNAIELANLHNFQCLDKDKIDVLIVGRGGGSVEDLWAFNEEIVARAIANSSIPIISAVGHERDFTIADLVADLRAPTPTAAAKMIVEARKELINRLNRSKNSLIEKIRFRLISMENRINKLRSPLERTGTRIKDLQITLNRYNQRLKDSLRARISNDKDKLFLIKDKLTPAAILSILQKGRSDYLLLKQRLISNRYFVEKFRNALEIKEASLRARSPLAILERGYAIVFDQDGKVIRDSSQVVDGEEIKIKLAKGRITSIVTDREI